MNDQERYRRAVRAVWERSFREYEGWSELTREAVRPAVDALLTWLEGAANEADLMRHYWESGDAPARILRRHLPSVFDAEDVFALEEACFWMRLDALDATT